MASKKEIMSPEKFRLEMIFAFKSGDTEADHGKADDLMCKLLTELGYGEGVKIFESMKKWYA